MSFFLVRSHEVELKKGGNQTLFFFPKVVFVKPMSNDWLEAHWRD